MFMSISMFRLQNLLSSHLQSKELFDDDEFKRILDKKSEERSREETEVLLESMKHMTVGRDYNLTTSFDEG